jgi:hypothetical protein
MPIENEAGGGDLSLSREIEGGERLEEAQMGWHDLEGDRRLSFRRMDDRGGSRGQPQASCLS